MTNIKRIGRITTMDYVAMIATNICGVQMVSVDTSPQKPLLYQFAWKMLKYVENKKLVCWHSRNSTSLHHLPMVFMGNLHKFFKNLALFSQNSIETPTELSITSFTATLKQKSLPLR
jgi:hypothetical protein